jgi:hypothetical protein
MGVGGGTSADDKERGGDNAPPDPAALRARLKHRPPTRIDSSSTSSYYDKVLDTARQVAELTRLRALDASYIQTLEQTQKTLSNELHAAGRERAQTERQVASRREEEERKRRWEVEEAVKKEAVNLTERERERAEEAERRVRALEEALKSARERIEMLEGLVEREKKVREEWVNGLEALALGGVGGGGGNDGVNSAV